MTITVKNARRRDAAGASLSNVVRIPQLHGDLAEFYPVHATWRRHLGGAPLPFSAVGEPAPLAIPGCSVLMDPWIYAPWAGRRDLTGRAEPSSLRGSACRWRRPA
jgi:hypothetical protein